VPQERLVVLVNGIPGAGKTTLSRPLAQELRLPLFGKDTIKETWADIIGSTPSDGSPQPAWNALLGAAASETMWNLLAQSGCGGIVESPMPARIRHFVVAGLAQAAVTRPLEIWCDVPADLARKRVEERWPTAHPIHGEIPPAQDWFDAQAACEPVGIGPVLRVDTSRPVDIHRIAAWCHSQ
jgi:glucokinase